MPFVGVLDEAANICRIRHLDTYYSHFGSRGIVLLTVLQSWAQGAEAWVTCGLDRSGERERRGAEDARPRAERTGQDRDVGVDLQAAGAH